ncbi:uncharacterized protein PG986_005929 [Apiospora aurea]|uniref:Uncharacterized protein n=1 Tax=Apiospora aurea TaxID=335848 RepID=A0ABR1QJ04_9PEZI
MQYLFALVFFLLGLGANAATLGDIMNNLPDGGYSMDMYAAHNGIVNITDLNGNLVEGSPFIIDIISTPAPVIRDPNPNGNQTKDQWGAFLPDTWCIANEFGDYGFWQTAGQNLGTWCDGNQMPGHQIKWWQVEQELAYICNYANVQHCSGHEWYDYMQNTIGPGCHGNGAGWFLQGSGDKTYGRGLKGGPSDPSTVCSNLV